MPNTECELIIESLVSLESFWGTKGKTNFSETFLSPSGIFLNHVTTTGRQHINKDSNCAVLLLCIVEVLLNLEYSLYDEIIQKMINEYKEKENCEENNVY